MAELTQAEAAVYDRQLRVWGVETQKKLSASSILIIGCTGLAAEVAKNIVLAGVGSATLADDTPSTMRPSGNFLVHIDADPKLTVAQASVAVLQEMNPLVKVLALPGTPESLLTKDTIGKYSLVMIVGQPAHIIQQADAVCSEAGVPFYAAASRGLYGWAFANLHEHKYRTEKKKEQKDGTVTKIVGQHVRQFVPWEQAINAQNAVKNMKRASPLYRILQVAMPLEEKEKRSVAAEDLPALKTALSELCKARGIDESLLSPQALEAYVTMAEEMPAVNAVVGGVIANDLIKAASANGQPVIDNMFMFTVIDNSGWVERLE